MSNPVKEPPPSTNGFDPDAYRDAIATVDQSGARSWIFPKKPKGDLYTWRKRLSWVFLTLLFAGPFLRYKGEPFLLFNILERKFILFGITFWPQDFHLFVLAMITFFVFIVLFTVIFGRIWCGWACPQTIFMEMVFRRVEYWIEGDSSQQRKLAKAPWNREKILKKGSKWSIFAVIAFLIGNLVMAYIVGTDELFKYITESPSDNWGKFTFVLIFSGIFYFVFAWFREQACIAVCPYGRLQGVLLGKDSIVVAYDWIRGEPRGKLKRKAQPDAAPQGDCIDCKLCVAVCPTGIDIRNGTQMECVNCTACIDACDDIMEKVNKPKGLIRLDSFNGIESQTPAFRWTPRILAYSGVLVALLSILSFSLASRADVEATILRTPGMLYQEQVEGYISNLYSIQVVNKTTEQLPVEIRIDASGGNIRLVGQALEVAPRDISKGVFFVDLPRESLDRGKNKIFLEIWSGDRRVSRVKTSFVGP
ncbi:MAG: cytochrome c oxidase accessory protein CcoG [Bacteroidota bacterium]